MKFKIDDRVTLVDRYKDCLVTWYGGIRYGQIMTVSAVELGHDGQMIYAFGMNKRDFWRDVEENFRLVKE